MLLLAKQTNAGPTLGTRRWRPLVPCIAGPGHWATTGPWMLVLARQGGATAGPTLGSRRWFPFASCIARPGLWATTGPWTPTRFRMLADFVQVSRLERCLAGESL